MDITVSVLHKPNKNVGVATPLFYDLCYYILMDAFGVHTTQSRFLGELQMTNLMKYNAANLDQLLDRINRNSIGMDEYFDRLFNLHETTSNYPPYNLVTVINVESSKPALPSHYYNHNNV